MVYVPVDQAVFNANVEGAVKSEPVMDHDNPDVQKMVGPEDARVPAWVIHVAYSDALDPYGGDTETVKVRINSHKDPSVSFGPIVLGGVRCQEWVMVTPKGEKRGLSWSCDSFTQEPKPSTTRELPPEPASKPTAAAKK